jgi:uncharacterized protein YerC
MRITKKRLSKNLETQVQKVFYQLIADLKDTDETEVVLRDFLSQPARLSLAKKLSIALLLDKKRSYQDIKDTLKVSSSTIAEVDGRLSSPGLQLAVRKVKTDEWADRWSKKINKALERILARE